MMNAREEMLTEKIRRAVPRLVFSVVLALAICFGIGFAFAGFMGGTLLVAAAAIYIIANIRGCQRGLEDGWHNCEKLAALRSEWDES